MKAQSITIDGNHLRLQDLVNVARAEVVVSIEQTAAERVLVNRQRLEAAAAGNKKIYGVNTGFGDCCDVLISSSELKTLQLNLIRSHAAGVGDILEPDVVRAMMLLRANTLVKGYSGIKLETIQTLVMMINEDVIPIIPDTGSLGASGDLVPLAHMAMVLVGEGDALYQGRKMSGAAALSKAGLTPVVLDTKEGLALLNGTPAMTALGALAVNDSLNLLKHADVAGAMSVEALWGKTDSFDERLAEVRQHAGHALCAEHIRSLLSDSSIKSQHRDRSIQDVYSIRCIPQVHGAVLDTIMYALHVVETEMNSSTDNPLVFGTGSDLLDTDVLSGGNFHGQPVSVVLDYLAIALTVLSTISERRIEHLNNHQINDGLPAFLTENPGLNSGFMIAQYTAAALVSDNRVLATPASIDSIPVSANKEDHVSMGMTAARKVRKIVKNVRHILAIELLCACQAIDLRKMRPGVGCRITLDTIREQVPKLEEDRSLSSDIIKVADLIFTRRITNNIDSVIGTSPF